MCKERDRKRFSVPVVEPAARPTRPLNVCLQSVWPSYSALLTFKGKMQFLCVGIAWIALDIEWAMGRGGGAGGPDWGSSTVELLLPASFSPKSIV